MALRADANGAIGRADLAGALDALGAAGVSLVEEPGAVEHLIALGSSPVPVALDESLAAPDAAELIEALAEAGMLGAVVLKPASLGGILPALDVARDARRFGAAAIASHTLDGPVAFAAACAMALVLGPSRAAAGLDPHAGLGAWPSVALPMVTPSAIVPWWEPGLGMDEEQLA